MLTPTSHTVDIQLLKDACIQLPEGGMKTSINRPTGNFFYDAWELKDEYKGTVWETLYNSLPEEKGEARIIILDPGHSYTSHADIDDRFHLNILGNQAYIIDLDNKEMFQLTPDGVWYDMNAGLIHVASNFGRVCRIQLVVRKLLKNKQLQSPTLVTITTILGSLDRARFEFDNTISPWLNKANKLGFINDFSYTLDRVQFNIENSKLESLKLILPVEFKIE